MNKFDQKFSTRKQLEGYFSDKFKIDVMSFIDRNGITFIYPKNSKLIKVRFIKEYFSIHRVDNATLLEIENKFKESFKNVEVNFSKKYNYKIYDKSSGKYLSPTSGSKSTWQRAHAIFDWIDELTAIATGRGFVKTGRYTKNDLEIHMFPLETGAIKVPAIDFYNHYKDKEELKLKANDWDLKRSRRLKKKREEISESFGLYGTVDAFRKLIENGTLTGSHADRVAKEIIKYDKIKNERNPFK